MTPLQEQEGHEDQKEQESTKEEYQNFLKPTYESVEKTFYPYIRLQSRGSQAYEVTKTVICTITLLPLRIIGMIFIGIITLVVAKIAMLGIGTGEDYIYQPLSKWRAMLLMIIPSLARCLLFFMGIYSIKETNREWKDLQPALSTIHEQNPPITNPYNHAFVIVANHLGYIDILVLLAKYDAAFVAKGELEKVAFVGTIARALQVLFVKKDRPLTATLVERIQQTYRCHEQKISHDPNHVCGSCLTKLVIFPEGTTNNGDSMIYFRTGVFRAARPVQPIAIKFPFRHFSLSWESIHFREHLFRTMTQFVNYVELVKLPVYTPSEKEEQNPVLFAQNVQRLLAHALDQDVYPLSKKHKGLYHQNLLGKMPSEDALKRAEEETEKDETLQQYFSLGV